MAIFATLIKTASLDRLGQGEFVSLMGKTRPLVKSLGMVTYEEEDTGYGRCLLNLFRCASKFLQTVPIVVSTFSQGPSNLP